MVSLSNGPLYVIFVHLDVEYRRQVFSVFSYLFISILMTCQIPYHPANLECLLMTLISRVWVNSLQLTLSLPRGSPLTSKIVWR